MSEPDTAAKLQAELDALKADSKALLEQLESNKQMTDQEKSKVDELRKKLLTAEEQAKRDKERIEKAAAEEKASLVKAAEQWKTRYTEATIKRELLDAAVGGQAFNPNQVISILRPSAKLVEGIDADGQPNGEYATQIDFDDVDKNGKPVRLVLTAADAVKRMRERDDFKNLFKDLSKSGTGGGTPESKSLTELARDPVKYREYRAKHGV